MKELLDFSLDMSAALTGNYRFWVCVTLAALVEPVLCSRYPVGGTLAAQSIVLFVSIALYVVQIGGELASKRNILLADQPRQSWMDITPIKILLHFLGRGEYVLEFICLLCGVVFLYTYPGIAVLRCFRVFRLLWLSDNKNFKHHVTEKLAPVFGSEFMHRCFKVCKFSIRSLSALGNEMFRLTEKTRGGLFLMLVLFYMAFVFGTALWIETGDDDNDCRSLGSCMYVMLRLTFFDGTGLDYAYSLTTNHTFLFYLTMAYMCVSTFGVINGMIGIFGTVFTMASEEAFENADGAGKDQEVVRTSEVDDHHDAGAAGDAAGEVNAGLELNPMPAAPTASSPSDPLNQRPLTPHSSSSSKTKGDGTVRAGEAPVEKFDNLTSSTKKTRLFSSRKVGSSSTLRGESVRMMMEPDGDWRQVRAEVEHLRGEMKKIAETQDLILGLLQGMHSK